MVRRLPRSILDAFRDMRQHGAASPECPNATNEKWPHGVLRDATQRQKGSSVTLLSWPLLERGTLGPGGDGPRDGESARSTHRANVSGARNSEPAIRTRIRLRAVRWKSVRSAALWLCVIAIVTETGGAGVDHVVLHADAPQVAVANGAASPPIFGHPSFEHARGTPAPLPATSPSVSTTKHRRSGRGTTSGSGPASGPPHMLVLMEENKNESLLSSAHYLDGLANSYASDSSWYGIGRPSASNYLAVLSGSTQSVVGDCTPPACGLYPAASSRWMRQPCVALPRRR